MDDQFQSPHQRAVSYRALRRRSLSLLALGALCFGVLLSESINARGGQNREKVFEGNSDPRPKPVELIELGTANRSVKLGQKFEAAPDWLNGATFKVKNGSDKEIVYLELDLDLPDTAYSGNPMSFRLTLGRRPGAGNVLKEPLSVKPGGVQVIRVDEKKYEELSAFVRRRPPLTVSDINTVRVAVGFVVFTDGTAWAPGGYLRQDPANPKRYLNVGEKPPGR